MTTASATYPIGTPGIPWGDAERAQWLSRQVRQRSYASDVVSAIERLRARFDVVEYGRLDYPPDQLPAVRDPQPRLARRAAGGAGHRRRAWLRDQRRARRAAVRSTSTRRTMRSGSICWSRRASAPGPTSASIAGTRTRSIRTVRSARTARRRVGRADAPGRAAARARAGAHRSARDHRHRRNRVPPGAGRARRQAVRAGTHSRRLLPRRRQREPAAGSSSRR